MQNGKKSRKSVIAISVCLVAVIAASGIIGMNLGWFGGADKGIVLPPVRVPEGIAHASFIQPYNFEEAMEEADTVARIVIGNWLGENERYTFFEATVLECFKGDMPEKITFRQQGTSEYMMQGYPILTYGNEILMFLIYEDPVWCTENYPDYIDSDHTYSSINAYQTHMDISYDEAGERYYVARFFHLGESIEAMDTTTNLAAKKHVVSEVYANAVKIDSVMDKVYQGKCEYVFSEEDMLQILNEEKV